MESQHPLTRKSNVLFEKLFCHGKAVFSLKTQLECLKQIVTVCPYTLLGRTTTDSVFKTTKYHKR